MKKLFYLGNLELVSMLLYREANIEAVTNSKITPLMIACQKGKEEIAYLLINAGADINYTDNFKNTALHYATMSGFKSIIELLLKRPSINIYQKNNKNKTPIEMNQNKEIQQFFIEYLKKKKQQQQQNQKIFIHNINEPSNNQNKKNAQESSRSGFEKINLNDLEVNDYDENDEFMNDAHKVGPSDFHVHGLIGKGSFGEVYLVQQKNTNMLYAMKVQLKSRMKRQNLVKYAMTERNVLTLTNHPFIVKLNFAFQTNEKLFLLLDYCPGGDLGSHLQKEKKFSEERTRIYMAEIILALEDLHSRDIVFRDLKPENILLDPQGHAMLTDFGLSKEGVFEQNEGAQSFCGSLAYLAPEILKRQGHGKAVDWYLLGVIMYEMLVGIPPFYANNQNQLFYNIEKAPLKIPSSISQNAKSLLNSLLQRNPAKRLGSGKDDAEPIKRHKFFEGLNWNDVLNRKLKPIVPEIKIKINTKYSNNIFDLDQIDEENKINGWSFAGNMMK